MIDYIIKKYNICHQIPERSFYYKQKQFPVCARCTGIILGYCTIPLFYFGIIKISILFIILLNIPFLIDSVTQYMGYRESNNKLRLITGILTGFACSALVVLIVEILLSIF
jgi:uncharacterized membrane protein